MEPGRVKIQGQSAMADVASGLPVMIPAVARCLPAAPAKKDRTFVLPLRLDVQRVLCATAAVLAFASAYTAGGSAQAQGKLDARYTASLAGIPIGRGAWVLDIRDDQYTAAASGTTTGLLRVFASGNGTSLARGYVTSGQPVARNYAATITADKKKDEVEMELEGGNVKQYTVNPPPPPHPERIPVTEAHRRSVTDPMTASLVRVAGNQDPVAPDACERSTPIFDGRMRYDLRLAFKRMDRVKADKGYEGPVVVCSINFTPLAGYIPGRTVIKYLVNLRDMEVWLAPVAGTRVLVPFRISIPTPLGLGILEATQFVSAGMPPRATPTSAKTQ